MPIPVGSLATFYGEPPQARNRYYPLVDIRNYFPPTPVPPQDFSREIARGIALLNDRDPGWFHRVHTWSLNLVSGCDCVLGQVYGTYEGGKERLGLDYAGAVFHGFCIVGDSYHPQWMQLTMQWREAILRLQQGEQSPVVEEEEEMEIAIKHIVASIRQRADAILWRHEAQRAFDPRYRPLSERYTIAPPELWRITFDEINEVDRPRPLTAFLEAQQTQEAQQPERIEVRELCPV